MSTRPSQRSFAFKHLACELQRAAVLCHCTDDLIGSTTRNFCVDLQCDFDGGVHQSSEMGNDLVGDATGVAAYSGRIERDAAMKALGLRRLRTQGRLFFWSL